MTPPTPLLIFLRPPVPGRVKTRLSASLGGDTAAALYRAFTRDVLERVAGVPWLAPRLWVAGDPNHPALEALLARLPPWPRKTQVGAGLGARMRHALHSTQDDDKGALLIGTDVPTLPLERLDEARHTLRRADVVFGPCPDGGFYLVGARAAVSPPLDASGIRYSTPHALQDCLFACQDAGLTTALIDPHTDIDTLDDLYFLQVELARAPAAAAHTALVTRRIALPERP